jgi:predicted enzyme related to lactoylglutathione lyase
MKSDPVVHFEMPAKDRERVKTFYENVFGWQMQILGPEMGNYILAGTSPVDEKQMHLEKGAINGGFFDYKDDELNRAPHIVISVDDLDESIKAVKEAGGEIKTDKMDIQGIGIYVSFRDTEGNIVGMLQPSGRPPQK